MMLARLIPSSRYDKHGRDLTIVGHGDSMTMRVRGNRESAVQSHHLDADAAVGLAHELLERAFCDTSMRCDPAMQMAVRALRGRELRQLVYSEEP